MQEPWWEPQL
ncbi:hypothetical protein CGLO_00990 [Colletotrichum gloeosporioides Cg-14]|uniref:Uncharacterized protein n=1 Tax=Colletotrichum gloeosporioides (strain Cg-14) TaxID=1237896 RepID=T0MCK2_COLGC|nr:hypothetical protein CGLO_00990 [Colletotrichum gloeosporioides Cg-14]